MLLLKVKHDYNNSNTNVMNIKIIPRASVVVLALVHVRNQNTFNSLTLTQVHSSS